MKYVTLTLAIILMMMVTFLDIDQVSRRCCYFVTTIPLELPHSLSGLLKYFVCCSCLNATVESEEKPKDKPEEKPKDKLSERVNGDLSSAQKPKETEVAKAKEESKEPVKDTTPVVESKKEEEETKATVVLKKPLKGIMIGDRYKMDCDARSSLFQGATVNSA